MFRFEHPAFLWLLIIIPLLIIVYIISYKTKAKALKILGDNKLIKSLMQGASQKRNAIKTTLLLTCLSLLIIILAQPQMGTKITTEKRNGIEIMIALDISNSMLAQDVSPSRLEKSKLLIEKLTDNFTNDKIGIIVFAGDAFIQVPITTDYISTKMFLQNINPTLISTQGTDIAKALDLSIHSFNQKNNIGRAIILITDGEDHEGGILEVAKKIKDKGYKLFVLGIGDKKGSAIPLSNGEYLKDKYGEIVTTNLNEEMCKEIAQASGGIYIHVDNSNTAQKRIDSEISKLQKGKTESIIYSDYAEQFQILCIITIILLIIEICIMEKANYYFKRIKIFGTRNITLILLMLTFSVQSFANNDRNAIRRGNREYNKEKYEKAEIEYRKALSSNQTNAQALYNLGNALLMLQKDSAAIIQFEKAGKAETNKFRKAMSYHNIGVICQRHSMYSEAIKAYEEALRNNPKDDETRYNLALCKKLNKDQDKNKENNRKKQDNNKNKQQNNDKKQNDKDENKKQNKDKQQQTTQPKISRENAEQLLNAAVQNEKVTQERIKKAEQNSQRESKEKNW